MLLRYATDSFALMLTRPFRAVLIKALLLTAALLACLFFALRGIIDWLFDFDAAWLDLALQIASSVGVVALLGFLVAPIAGLFVGLYVDDVAEVVERERYPQDRVGRELPLIPSFLRSLRFVLTVLAVNMIALMLVIAFGIGIIVFFVANAFLLGREYFELAAMRHLTPPEAKALLQQNRSMVFLAGLMIACLLAVPLLNLLAPVFGTVLMVHVYKHARATVPPPVNADPA